MSGQQPVGFRGESGAAGRIVQETHLATARALLDTLPFYAMLVDSDHHIVVANKAVLVNLGREPSAIEGTYCPLTVHGLDHPFPGCPLEESIARGCTAAETEMFDERDGLWFASSIYPTEYRTSKDRQIFIHLVRDITAAKRSEEALQHNLQVEEVLASIRTWPMLASGSSPTRASFSTKRSGGTDVVKRPKVGMGYYSSYGYGHYCAEGSSGDGKKRDGGRRLAHPGVREHGGAR